MNIECLAGEAWPNLHYRLSCPPPPLSHKRPSLSNLCGSARCADANTRAAAEKAVAAEKP